MDRKQLLKQLKNQKPEVTIRCKYLIRIDRFFSSNGINGLHDMWAVAMESKLDTKMDSEGSTFHHDLIVQEYFRLQEHLISTTTSIGIVK